MPDPNNSLRIERRDAHLTEFTVEENYLLMRGYEVLARVSPSAGGVWKVSWMKNSMRFDTKDAAMAWLDAHKAEIAAAPSYA